ncbi:MAG: dihydroorotase [Lachnospiraceae bacterium]|nr:dihydroorotase [Lachnospiraceae bacterium]
MKILIKDGHVVDPATGIDGVMDILVEDGVITGVGKHIKCEADDVILAQGKYVMPGFTDLHVHLREPGFEYKETIKTGAMAAARGGFTTICPMPNTKPVIDSADMIEFLLNKAKEEACVRIVPIGAITKGQNGDVLSDIEAMVEKGAGALSEDGKSVMDTRLYKEAMDIAARIGVPIFAHCEDKSLVGKGVMNLGDKSRELGLEGISNAVEDIIAIRDILLAKETGAQLHLCHCSTKDSVEFVKWAKEQGLKVTGEVCPHHFAMSDDEIPCDDANYKMNPPLRSRADVEALKQGLKDGIMDVIATDHAPHSKEEKEKSMKDAPFGIVGLETAFALSVTKLVKTGVLTMSQLVEKLSYNPARIAHTDGGTLEVGRKADIVIADIDEEYRIDASKFASMGHNTPFDQKTVSGKILLTMVDGNVVYKAEN